MSTASGRQDRDTVLGSGDRRRPGDGRVRSLPVMRNWSPLNCRRRPDRTGRAKLGSGPHDLIAQRVGRDVSFAAELHRDRFPLGGETSRF